MKEAADLIVNFVARGELANVAKTEIKATESAATMIKRITTATTDIIAKRIIMLTTTNTLNLEMANVSAELNYYLVFKRKTSYYLHHTHHHLLIELINLDNLVWVYFLLQLFHDISSHCEIHRPLEEKLKLHSSRE